LLAGWLSGAVTGMVIGTVILPIFGTFVGALLGGVIGAVLGLVNGAVLVAVARRTRSGLAAGAAAAITSSACAAAGIGFVFGWDRFGSSWAARAIAAWCLVLGAVLGPVVSGTSGLNRLYAAAEALPRANVVDRFAIRGAWLFAVAGGVVGLVLGLADYPPTAPFTAVEGAAFAAAPGSVAAAAFALVRVARSEPNRPRPTRDDLG
jgi:hypothetical protein